MPCFGTLQDTTARAAASLAAVPAGQARGWLSELARAHLITERAPGRFTFHDLLRAYAIEQARAHDTDDDREAAVSRVLDHYLHTADAACLRLHSRGRRLTLAPPPPGVLPEEHPGSAAAWAWFDAEHPVLFAAVDLAAATGRATHAWQLAWTLMEFVDHQGRWHEWAATLHTALSAARRYNDRYGQAYARAGIGLACRWLGRDDEAYSQLQQALALCVALGDAVGQAGVHIVLGRVCEYKGRLAAALQHDRDALALFRAVGDSRGEATALNNAGWHHALLGDHHKALDRCGKALTLFQQADDHRGEAYTLDSLGYAYYHLGNYQKAVSCYQQSAVRHREVGSGYHMAMVLGHLGDALEAAGDQPAARTAWQQALAILEHLSPVLPHGPGPGYPDPGQIRAKLAHEKERPSRHKPLPAAPASRPH